MPVRIWQTRIAVTSRESQIGLKRQILSTSKLNCVNPQAYFTDLLTRLVNGLPQKRIDELVPWCWGPERPP
jgi:hypothetical protein